MKKIIVTGASSGLGRAFVEYFAKMEHCLFAISRNTHKIKDLLDKYPLNIHCFDCDISDPKQVVKTFSNIEKDFGVADVLINNAGIFCGGPFSECDIDTIDRVIDTNLKGYMYCTLQVSGKMKTRKSGHIINISSVSGIHGLRDQSIYGASKHGINGFSDVLTQELKDHNVKVHCICPGGIDTPLWNEDNPYPLENHLIKPEEIVELVNFLICGGSKTIYRRIVMFPDNEWH
ncbi:MAG TPA: SDR family NAD(P)-dependent oxidoreductase [Cyclobacteriaceae bacterium]